MLRNQLINLLNEQLNAKDISDFCPNGLQVEGAEEIKHIVTGVTASDALISAAIDLGADTILVHHGYFWKGESAVITGLKKQRLAKLLAQNINLVAYHLPIDVHHELGNNVQLGRIIGCTAVKPVSGIAPLGIVMQGSFEASISHDALKQRLLTCLAPNNVVSVGQKSTIKNIAWCTGGGQNYIDTVAQNHPEIDAFVSGEISEQTTHSAREQGIDFFAAGHHATERYGVKAVGEWLMEKHNMRVTHVDIPNPA